jgi:hypothetical protein
MSRARVMGAFYVYTEADSWKVKRIRNDPRARPLLLEPASRATRRPR